MEQTKIDLFLASNSEKFEPGALLAIKDALSKMSDDQFIVVQSASYRNPTLIFVIALLLGWERFFLDDIGLGVLKVLTCYGLGIWWLIDLFTAFDRTKKFNYKKFMEVTALLR